MKSNISISRLCLVGHRKNYSIPFYPGVNIIYGDSDTGKSSILEFINYLLGASSIELADEVKASVMYAALELEINGAIKTIKRNIFNSKDYIEVYPCGIDECVDFFPKKYCPDFSDKNAPDGFFSDFMLDSLGFPKVKIKVSPSKADSDVKRLSFRNVFKYVYVNQDDVGSRSFLDLSNYVLATSNREVLKYIFNVLDSSITELEAEISARTKDSKAILNKYTSVSEFLRETDYDSRVSLDDAITEIDKTLELLNVELEILNKNMVAGSKNHTELKSIFNELSLNEKHAELEMSRTREQIEKYSRLKNDYENDVEKIHGILHAQTKIGSLSSIAHPCPVCDTSLEPLSVSNEFQVSDNTSLTDEVNSIQKKKKSIQSLIDDLAAKSRSLAKDHALYKSDLAKAREMLDTESKTMVTPYLVQRDSIIKEIATNAQVRTHLVTSICVRNQQQKIHDSYENVNLVIKQLNERLAELKKSAPSTSEVLSKLSGYLKKYLKLVNIKRQEGISISPTTFAPVIRERDYLKITSGGLRTISSVGFMVSLLEYAIDYEINHPRLLMIDTVGKYLGKTLKEKYKEQTSPDEDSREGISDPLKYQNMYEYLLGVATRAEEKEVPCQIILVDNDVPETFVNRYKTYIVAQYSSTGENGLPLGLIDDVEKGGR
ncbi:exonuclease SbcC [Pseudomonas savastanoi pv. phaseolicola]|uniref:AAA family ATPase n=1 Tax=Pseudomonas savastanoi TaxID=29438 RepID=UPI001969A3F1|nr:AAA family ATPase [Pseudomonas savastanoi]MBN3471256.1 exonuclease SbcC [Pseudomonas savastanoi pv. phaseolicola]MBN3478267.1 exonuclease SbcC [Pseudomonas savastanoi pv. phaseolicola]